MNEIGKFDVTPFSTVPKRNGFFDAYGFLIYNSK
jgi:hypothetical protein